MQNKWIFIYLILAGSSPAHALSLQEALQIALTQNPKPKSKDMLIEAMKDHTNAAKARFFPTLSFDCSLSQDRGDMRMAGETSPRKSHTTGCGGSVFFNLFSGGTDYYGVKLAEANQKAQEALYNSTNPFIENTKGALASQLVHAYTNISLSEEAIGLIELLRRLLDRAIAATRDEDDKSAYKAQIQNLEIELQNATDGFVSARQDYQFIVTEEAPEQLDSLDQIITSLVIPIDPKAALEQAKVSSPDLKRRVHQLKAAEYSYKIASSYYWPDIDLTVSRNRTRALDRLNSDNSYADRDNWVGITASWNFSASSVFRQKAAKKELTSAQLEQEGIMRDLEQNIEKTYFDYNSNTLRMNQYEQKYIDSKAQLENDIQRLESGQSIPRGDVLRDLNDFSVSASSLLRTKQKVIMLKFSVQQVVGTLF